MGSRKSEIHMHSTHSDGEFSPEGLVQIAKRNGVGILALTDHDTFSGIPEFLEAAEKEDIVLSPVDAPPRRGAPAHPLQPVWGVHEAPRKIRSCGCIALPES